MKLSFISAIILALAPCCLQAQTPTLSQAAAKAGIGGNLGNAPNFEFYMDPASYPRAVTAGETVFMMGSWPTGNDPTMSDDKSNTWAGVTSCADNDSTTHGFFYAVNAAAGTSVLTETHSSNISNGVFDWAHFYNMSTTASGFLDGSSCTVNLTPSNNSAPNISGTSYTINYNNDLILTCVYAQNSSMTAPNAISAITWPSGFTGLGYDLSYGHACAYGISGQNGVAGAGNSFTPTFTLAQSTHNTFTIMSAAFRNGTGGAGPTAGASVLLSETLAGGFFGGGTKSVYLPCPSNTSAVVIGDDAGDVTGVSDSQSNTWTGVSVPGSYWGPIYYTNSPTISTNSYTVSVTFKTSENIDDVVFWCATGTNGIDTGVTAPSGYTLTSDAVYDDTACTSSGNVCSGISELGSTTAYDLVFDAGAFGTGPAISCVTGHCVFDYVGSTDWTNGDTQAYSNGDVMAHYYDTAGGTVSFNFNVEAGVSGGNAISLAFLQSSSTIGPPAPPTGLTAVVQ